MQTIYRRLEPETIAYNTLLGGVNPNWWTLNEQIKAIKYSTGISIANVVANLSTVNGTAFVTNPVFTATGLPANDLRWAVGFKLSFAAAGKTLVGYGKAAGTGETLNIDIFASFDFTSGWAGHGSGTITDANTFATPVAYGGIYKTADILTQGELMKYSYSATSSAGTPILKLGALGDSLASGSSGLYHTIKSSDNKAYMMNTAIAASIDVATLAAQQVLTPSASGLTIVSAAGGSTYNWTSNDGLPPNSASFALQVTRN
jgi:hypothetical protein